MKKQFVNFFWIVAGSLMILILLRQYNSKWEAEKKIFFSREDGFYLNRVLNRLPIDMFYRLYEESIIENTKEYMLVALSEKTYGDHTYIVLRDKTADESKLLLGHLGLIEFPKGIDCLNYESFLVDLSVFNDYLNFSNIHDEPMIIEKFVQWVHLNSISDSLSWKIVYTYDELKGIKLIGKNRGLFLDTIVIDELINQIHLDNNKYTYVWYECCGLVEYKWTFSENNLINVKSKFIGFFGNEMPPHHSWDCR